MEIPSIYPQTRFGCPTGADQILPNGEYLVFYRNLWFQPLAVMQAFGPGDYGPAAVEREDDFREDKLVPIGYRATLADYAGSGYDRGHLAPSACHRDNYVENARTFLLTNMAPMRAKFNRQVWAALEKDVRSLIRPDNEVFTISGPIFDPYKPARKAGRIPVPHGFFKSVLIHHRNNDIETRSYVGFQPDGHIPDKCVEVTQDRLELIIGFDLWDRVNK